jgi:hypothetical protein
LTPDRALTSLEDAANFLQDRGMLTRMPDCSLPSLFGACHEAPANPAGRGFDLWPKSKWIWSFQLARDPRTLLTKLHRGKSLYLSMKTARAFDPLVRQAIDSAQGDDAALLEHIGRHGASMNEDVMLELGWDGKRLKSSRKRLERVGAVLSDGLVFESSTSWYFAPMRRWDQVVRSPARSEDPLGDVIVAGVSAAIVAPESEIGSWFSWPLARGIFDQLVHEGRLSRPAPGLLASTATRDRASA